MITNLGEGTKYIRSLPTRVLLRKIRNRVNKYIKHTIGLLRVRLQRTDISNSTFLIALDDRFSTSQGWLEYLASKKCSKFFLNPDRRSEIIELLRKNSHDTERHIIAIADDVCDHRFNLLGSGTKFLGVSIDWHIDFKTGCRFDPNQFYMKVHPASYPGGYDIKIPWELSRCQHFTWLGQAYWFTEDEKYAREFVAQVLDWCDKNPPKLGVNWSSTMDVAIRAINWLWGYNYFKKSPSLGEDFLLVFFKSLLAHGRHIYDNLENDGDFTGNHYLSNLVGLIYVGTLCPEFKDAEFWRDFGLRELEKEMFKQVYPDGVDFEASVSYHRFATELFLSAVILANLHDHTFSHTFMSRLEKMLEFVRDITKPDGSVPLFGDNDNGRIHRLKVWRKSNKEWIDHRYLLAIGAVLFDRYDFAQAAGNQWEEAIWLLGLRGIRKFEKLGRKSKERTLKSAKYEYAGIHIIRHEDFYLAIDAGPIGQNGFGGHAHNDTLSFELFVDGINWIVDPGMFVYTADYDLRNQFRSTAYHNTIIMKGIEQNTIVPKKLFLLADESKVDIIKWENSCERSEFVAELTNRKWNLTHYREFQYIPDEKCLTINDQVIAGNNNLKQMELNFHFYPGAIVERSQDGTGLRIAQIGQKKVMQMTWDKNLVKELEIGEKIFAFGYGSITKGKYLKISASLDHFSTNISFLNRT